jgi:hypothetical protein
MVGHDREIQGLVQLNASQGPTLLIVRLNPQFTASGEAIGLPGCDSIVLGARILGESGMDVGVSEEGAAIYII